MASQLLAAQIIPSLGITGLAAIPPGKLASHHDFLRLLFHHQHYNLNGFKGIRSVSCKLDSKTKKARCHEEGDPTSLWCDTRASCLQLGSPCLLAKVKENWETARLPLKDNDDHLLRVLEKVKSGYDKVGGRRGLTEADIEVLKKTTVNLAPQDWEKRILNDSLTSAVQHRMKIDSRSEIDNKFSPCWFRCCLPFVVDVVSCVVLDYLLEKLRRRLCYAGDIITPLQEPSIWNIMLPILN